MWDRTARKFRLVSCWMTPVFTATAAAMLFPALCVGWGVINQFPVLMA